MATLKEIAREAGVSVSTVSLVVNGKPCVSQDKRQRVIEIIRARKYVPNYAARALRKRHAARTYAIGVLTPAPLIAFSSSSHVYRIIAGAEQAVKQKKYHLVLGSLEPLAEGIFHLPRMLEAGEVDGILIISTAALEMEKIVGSVASFSTPVVLCGYPGQDFNLPSVLIDNEKAAYEATLALLKSGYPKVATITGPLSYPSAAARLRGYRLALVENGLFPDETLVEEGDFSELSGAEAMKRLLRHLTPPF
ncbi:MAG TPA: LacI family DNA-binding transcriptional regulator, partial [bacterium]|nr:LacI family DNA-binding transcriptional regulator [bacterium]